MQTLQLGGESGGIRVNCLAPTASTATATAQGVLTLKPWPSGTAGRQSGTGRPGGEDAPTRCILLAGAGSVESADVTMTQGKARQGKVLS